MTPESWRQGARRSRQRPRKTAEQRAGLPQPRPPATTSELREKINLSWGSKDKNRSPEKVAASAGPAAEPRGWSRDGGSTLSVPSGGSAAGASRRSLSPRGPTRVQEADRLQAVVTQTHRAGVVRRFHSAAAVLARLEHPDIARLLNSARHGGRPPFLRHGLVERTAHRCSVCASLPVRGRASASSARCPPPVHFRPSKHSSPTRT